MKHLSLLSLIALISAVASPAVQAGIISRDWKTPGDGLLTYDDVNQREWLDLTASRLSGFVGTTLEERYQNLLTALGPSGAFAGFTPAKESDVAALAQSAGIEISTNDFAVNATPVGSLIDAVGTSASSSSSANYSFGLLDEVGPYAPFPELLLRKVGGLRVNPTSGPAGQAQYWTAAGDADGLATPARTGVWLYRPVPEPTSLLLACAGLLCLRGLVR